MPYDRETALGTLRLVADAIAEMPSDHNLTVADLDKILRHAADIIESWPIPLPAE
jgi:hypothetical protein